MPPARKHPNRKETPVSEETSTDSSPKTVAPEAQSGITNIEQLTNPSPTPDAPPVKSDPPKEDKDQEQKDIEELLARKSGDGKGSGDIPESDFKSFANPNAERPSATRQQEIEVLADEVLAGKWGIEARTVRDRLTDAGHSATLVHTQVNKRLSTGAPSALPKRSVTELASEVIRGEWGFGEPQIKQRLDGAGYGNQFKDVEAEVKKQLGG